MLNLHGQLLYEYILVNVECHSARTSALAWVDTTHRREGWVREGQRERERHLLWSPTLICPIVPGPTASLWFTLLFSRMHECVCWGGEEWIWEVGRRACGSKGMLCHMADSLLRLRESSKEIVGTRDKQRKHCAKCLFFYKPFNLLLV